MTSMRVTRFILLVLGFLTLVESPSFGQQFQISSYRKKAKYGDFATIVFKSSAKGLDIASLTGDTIFRTEFSGEDIWTTHVDLNRERSYGENGMLNRRFLLSTPYIEDSVVVVPGQERNLQSSTYYYDIKVINYYPYNLYIELPLRPDWCFGLRIGAGKRFGGYVTFKLGLNDNDGMNANDNPKLMEIKTKKYLGRIYKVFAAGVRYGLYNREFPLFGYMGIGYGEAGYAYSNGLKGKNHINFYRDFTQGIYGEMGVTFVLFDFFSLSFGAEAVFGSERVFPGVGLSIGVTLNPYD